MANQSAHCFARLSWMVVRRPSPLVVRERTAPDVSFPPCSPRCLSDLWHSGPSAAAITWMQLSPAHAPIIWKGLASCLFIWLPFVLPGLTKLCLVDIMKLNQFVCIHIFNSDYFQKYFSLVDCILSKCYLCYILCLTGQFERSPWTLSGLISILYSNRGANLNDTDNLVKPTLKSFTSPTRKRPIGTDVELSERDALPPSLRRLEAIWKIAGIIRQYAALLSPQPSIWAYQAFIPFPSSNAKDAREDFAQSVQEWPEVLSCFALTGRNRLPAPCVFTDMNSFSPFRFGLRSCSSSRRTRTLQSSFVLGRNQKHNCPVAGTRDPG